jgi:outer membrane protein OmpA-like peptidoglycan-associated protein
MRYGAFILAIVAVLVTAAGCAPGPPAPSAVPAERPQKYVVFFDFKSAALTPEMLGVIAQAGRAARESGTAHLIVIGHADGFGSAKDNRILSERRARAVEAALVAGGIPKDGITAIASGAHDEFAKARPGVREPVNRRVVIRLDS